MDPPDERFRLTLACIPPPGPGRGPGALAFAVKDVDMSEYHFHLFNALSRAAFERLPEAAFSGYMDLLRAELKARVHGEVDQLSWAAEQNLLNKQTSFRGETKLFRGVRPRIVLRYPDALPPWIVLRHRCRTRAASDCQPPPPQTPRVPPRTVPAAGRLRGFP
jgi:hypothetical protein